MTPDQIQILELMYSVIDDAKNFVSKYVLFPKSLDDYDLQRHIISIENWSSSINMFGMSAPLDIERSSIELSISSQPRKFFSRRDSNRPIKEIDVVCHENSVVIIGDPGSGKTTIIKRMIRKIILSESLGGSDIYNFPILVFGREICDGNSLFQDLFSKIGYSLCPVAPNLSVKEAVEWRRQQAIHTISATKAALLNANVLIFIDGIDEMSLDSREIFNRDVEELNNSLSNGKIIMTCRSGDWTTSLSNFSILEMMPLAEEEISNIIVRWSDDKLAFMSAIDGIPYQDLLDRPLFLTILILLYNQTGYLPERPVDVYQKIVMLLLEKWDNQRGIKRISKFSDFWPEAKFRFLTHIAFDLISEGKSRFSIVEARGVISTVGTLFGLNPWDAASILQELEAHTGLIVESGFENYEFCHLTVQEFLAGYHLVSLPNVEVAKDLLAVSPSAVAIAVSLSANSTEYFSEVIIKYIELCTRNHGSMKNLDSLRPFVARLKLENPAMLPSGNLGDAVISIAYGYIFLITSRITGEDGFRRMQDLDYLFELEAVRESLIFIEDDLQVTGYDRDSGGIAVKYRPGIKGSAIFGDRNNAIFPREVMSYFRAKCVLDTMVRAWERGVREERGDSAPPK